VKPTIVTLIAVLAAATVAVSGAQAPAALAKDSPSLRQASPVAGESQAKVGEPAPNFTLDALVGKESGKEFKKISLSDYRGKWVVLFFYPLDFTFVCPTEIKGFNEVLDAFRKLNAEVIGASVDSKYAHLAWLQRGDLGNLKYPLLSDIRKEVAARYGILDEKEGVAQRGLFIIDPNGILQYRLVHNLSVGRSVDETLRVLAALQTGELCPLGWKPGEKTLGK
jgi:alkyl hydroperoxide reductase subunit AhpC